MNGTGYGLCFQRIVARPPYGKREAGRSGVGVGTPAGRRPVLSSDHTDCGLLADFLGTVWLWIESESRVNRIWRKEQVWGGEDQGLC